MKDVIIIGGGYSVTEGIDKGLWDKIKGKEVWSLNSCFKAMPIKPTIQLWVDIEFFKNEVDNLQRLHASKVKLVAKESIVFLGLSQYIELHETTRERPKYYGRKALENKLLYYGWMGLSGTFALSYAIALGYERIFLLGYDFGSPSLVHKKTHWYQDEIPNLKIISTGAGRPEVYLHYNNGEVIEDFLQDFEVFTKEDAQILNVSTISNIPYFPKLTYDEFFKCLP